jgi:cytochrome b subunit of formate dehydrogenase
MGIANKNIEMEVQRFTRLQRILHILMIVSFLSLALTGLTLKFAYTKWAYILSHILGGFESTGFIHRFAAVIMLGVFFAHLVDLYRTKKKEKKTLRQLIFGPDSMMFNKKDLNDFISSLKWFL